MTVRVKMFRPAGFLKGYGLQTAKVVDKLLDTTGFRDRHRRELQHTYERHVKNAFYQIGRQLSSPALFTNMYGNGARRITAHDGEGKEVAVMTPSWEGLTAKYSRSKPISTRMWSKRGQSFYHTGLADYWKMEAGSGNVSVSARPGKSSRERRASDPKKIRIITYLDVNASINPVIERLIVAPFVSANEMRSEGFSMGRGGVNRQSTELLFYPETGPYRRPFVARLAARLGRSARTALRNL